MTKVVTLTLNTAIDEVIEVDSINVGGISNVQKMRFFPAGKGINVARTVAALRHQVIALGIIGKADIARFRSVKSKWLKTDLLALDQETRTNITIYDTLHKDIHIRGKGFSVTKKEINGIADKLGQYIKRGDIVVFAGSLPDGVPVDTYCKLGKMCKKYGALVLLDSSGEAMKVGIKCSPYLIKPNLEELGELVGKKIQTSQEIIEAMKQVSENYYIAVVFVSLGSKGALIYEKRRRIVFQAKIKDKDFSARLTTVGCGDALVGGVCAGIIKHKEAIDRGEVNNEIMCEIISKGMACGIANLYAMGPGVISVNDVNQYIQRIQISSVPETRIEEW